MDTSKKFNFNQALHDIKDRFNFDFVALALVQPADLHFVLKWEFVVGNQSERYRRIVLQTGKGVAGIVFKTGKPMIVSDVNKELSKKDLFNYPIIFSEKLTSFGAIPLFEACRVVGVLLVGFRDHHVLDEELFQQFKQSIGQNFGPYYKKEMVEEI